MPKGDFFACVANHIDQEIHRHYRLYASNRVAAGAPCSDEEKATFNHYIDQQISRIQLDTPDVPFLRERLITMYANPYKNAGFALNDK
jgi:hypothetical protein